MENLDIPQAPSVDEGKDRQPALTRIIMADYLAPEGFELNKSDPDSEFVEGEIALDPEETLGGSDFKFVHCVKILGHEDLFFLYKNRDVQADGRIKGEIYTKAWLLNKGFKEQK